jgi:hypothetical protein
MSPFGCTKRTWRDVRRESGNASQTERHCRFLSSISRSRCGLIFLVGTTSDNLERVIRQRPPQGLRLVPRGAVVRTQNRGT